MNMRKIQAIHSCKNCDLCQNQAPLLDTPKKAEVFWVGLSAVKVTDTKKEIPLSKNTNTGKLISSVEENNKNISFYKTNLVKCLPLKEDKIRYPKIHEMKSCHKNLKLEIKQSKPKIIFLLGKAVSDFIMGNEKGKNKTIDGKFNYKPKKINDIYYIPIHHPSYILVYKRKLLDNYVSKLSSLLSKLALSEV